MEPIQLIDNPNLRPIIGNNPINVQNTNIPNSTINRISGPSVIPTIERPAVRSMEVPVVRGLEVPVVNMPDTGIKYPVINVPTQAEFNASVKAEKDRQAAEEAAKERKLPDTKPPVTQTPPAVQQTLPPVQTQEPVAEIPANTPKPAFTINGVDINLPDPSVVATAGAVAVVTTATTMVSGIALNMVKNAAEPLIREAVKNKFKIKLKQVKPVLHYVMTDTGHIDIFEYSADGTKLIDSTDNVEQYIRAQVETNAFYETENKIIIDDVVADKFTKEGQKRFKPLFAPAKKVAKKLSARLSF
jgi:hypothetical protein